MTDDKITDISLGACDGTVAIRANGTLIEIHSDGSVETYTNGVVHVRPPRDDMQAGPPPRVGQDMPDGSVYAGVSPDTHRPMYTTREDAPLNTTFARAQNYAAALDAHDHRDWRLPTTVRQQTTAGERPAEGVPL